MLYVAISTFGQPAPGREPSDFNLATLASQLICWTPTPRASRCALAGKISRAQCPRSAILHKLLSKASACQRHDNHIFGIAGVQPGQLFSRLHSASLSEHRLTVSCFGFPDFSKPSRTKPHRRPVHFWPVSQRRREREQRRGISTPSPLQPATFPSDIRARLEETEIA